MSALNVLNENILREQEVEIMTIITSKSDINYNRLFDAVCSKILKYNSFFYILSDENKDQYIMIKNQDTEEECAFSSLNYSDKIQIYNKYMQLTSNLSLFI